jgi:hypothetical protein
MIKLILTIWYSERDRSGNCYWAFSATDPATGKSCQGTISGGESNILAAAQWLVGDAQYHYSIVALKKRDFKRQTASYSYAGCNHTYQIGRFIKEGLGWEIKRENFRVVASRPAVKGREGNGFVHWWVGPNSTFRTHFDKQLDNGTVTHVIDECWEENGASWARRVAGKLYKVASVSENANSFGLHGHILVALDGEAWEVGRAIGDWLDSWKKGTIIEADPKGKFGWASHSVEIQHQLPTAPPAVVAEVWEQK